MAVFEDYSAYYDLLYSDKDYASEAEYIHRLIQSASPGAKTILNLGCGTGKHDALLAKMGYEICGVDLSETMIAIALQKNADSPIVFHVGDVRTFRTTQHFDVVISLFHVLSYQVQNEDLLQTFETAALHLKPGGTFIFDCWHGPGVITDKPVKRKKVISNEQLSIIRHATPDLYPQENRVDVNYSIDVSDLQNGNSSQIQECHRMRYLFQPEVELFADIEGFELVESFEWMKNTPPSFESWNAVYVLKNSH